MSGCVSGMRCSFAIVYSAGNAPPPMQRGITHERPVAR
jgi:hypothetical protein